MLSALPQLSVDSTLYRIRPQGPHSSQQPPWITELGPAVPCSGRWKQSVPSFWLWMLCSHLSLLFYQGAMAGGFAQWWLCCSHPVPHPLPPAVQGVATDLCSTAAGNSHPLHWLLNSPPPHTPPHRRTTPLPLYISPSSLVGGGRQGCAVRMKFTNTQEGQHKAFT